VKHLDIPSFFPNGAPLASKRRVAETGQDEASSCEQACPLAGGGFLTALFPDDFFIIDDCSLQPVLVPGVAYLSAENDVVHAND
jgi:hypothetical protein